MSETIREGETFYVTTTNEFHRQDIAVFQYYGNDYSSPLDEPGKFNQHWEKRFYRIIAISGDTILIKDDEVFINNLPIPLPPGAKLPYTVYAKHGIEGLIKEEDLVSTMEEKNDTLLYHLFLPADSAKRLQQRKADVIKVQREIISNNLPDTFLARASPADAWGIANYGPLYIPKPGDTITVTAYNYKLFKNIPGIQQGQNIIKEKLYFLLGDNRHGAEDSRFIGLISHSNMYGIVK